MRNDCRRVDRKVVVRSVSDRGVVRRLVIGSIRDREVGKRSDTDGRRLSDRGDGRFRNCDWLWNRSRIQRRGRRDPRFEISVGKPEGRGNGSCSEVCLVCARGFGLPSLVYRWGRETFPTTLP